MTQETTTPRRSGWQVAGETLGKIFKFLLRLTFVLIIGAGLGLALYWGIPWGYRTLVQPVQDNRARITVLEQRLEQTQLREQEQVEALQSRITSLEVQLTELAELAASREELVAYGEESAAALARIADTEAQLDELTQALADLETLLAAQDVTLRELETLNVELSAGLAETRDTRQLVGTLSGRMMLLQTAQDLLKVRLLLLEDNPRLAREMLPVAVAHLEQARAALPEEAETLEALQTRIEALDALIATNSFRVGPELEALWASVMELVTPLEPLLQETVAPEAPEPALSPLPTPPAP